MSFDHAVKTRRLGNAPMSEAEWRVRCDLAACYRLAYREGWDDLVYTHISAAVPGPEHHFLTNPFGLAFDEITASNLVKVDLDGAIIGDTPYGINGAGFVIHSAVHAARADVGCVMHLHTEAGMALSMLAGCGRSRSTPCASTTASPITISRAWRSMPTRRPASSPISAPATRR
jgi:ribulose-5-phosphate 4-epimerase/fuculose-1-phosphate aldolase